MDYDAWDYWEDTLKQQLHDCKDWDEFVAIVKSLIQDSNPCHRARNILMREILESYGSSDFQNLVDLVSDFSSSFNEESHLHKLEIRTDNITHSYDCKCVEQDKEYRIEELIKSLKGE